MRKLVLCGAKAASVGLLFAGTAALAAGDYPVLPVPFTAVRVTDQFWARRVWPPIGWRPFPSAFEQCGKTGRMDNFQRAAKALRGETLTNTTPPGYPVDDTDPYKVLEGASYTLEMQPDDKMKSYLDGLIAEFAAQEPVGYLYTARTIDPQRPHAWSGDKRWVQEVELSHELYDAGHLFEAAAAHYQATGETNLLGVALKEANLLKSMSTGPSQIHNVWPGHEIVEMGLCKLYRATGDQRALSWPNIIDLMPGGDDYHQSRIKPVEQREAVGHAVRAAYLYSGMADVAALTGDQEYVSAIDAIWKNVVGKKLYDRRYCLCRASRDSGRTIRCRIFPPIARHAPPQLTPIGTSGFSCCMATPNTWMCSSGRSTTACSQRRRRWMGRTIFTQTRWRRTDKTTSAASWFGCACCPGNISWFIPSCARVFLRADGGLRFT